MGEFSLIHWLLLAVVILLLFGPSKLPQLGAGLGEGIKNFKKALKGDDSVDVKAELKKKEEAESQNKKS